MSLFRKGPTEQDKENALRHVANVRRYFDPLIEAMPSPEIKAPLELTCLLTAAMLSSTVAPPKFAECRCEAIVRSFKYWEIKNSFSSEVGFVSILEDKFYNTFKDAYDRDRNPVYAVYMEFFQGNFCKHEVFDNAPFRNYAQKCINDLIKGERLTDLYPCMFV